MYLNGYGVEKDIQKAVIWLKKATLNGSASSAYTLAKLYENGEGVEQNIEEAYSYYQISAVLGNSYANYQVGKNSLQKGEIEKAVENFQEDVYKRQPSSCGLFSPFLHFSGSYGIITRLLFNSCLVAHFWSPNWPCLLYTSRCV